MHKLLLALPLTLAVAGCNGLNEQNSDEAMMGAVVGGLAGAVSGEDKNRERNIVLGAAAGAAAGAMIGDNDDCTYRRLDTGEVFTAPCGSY